MKISEEVLNKIEQIVKQYQEILDQLREIEECQKQNQELYQTAKLNLSQIERRLDRGITGISD